MRFPQVTDYLNTLLKRDKVHIAKHSLKLFITFLAVFDNMNLLKRNNG